MKMFVDYIPADNCQNMEESYDCVCVKCGRCGRQFTDDGILIPDDEEDPKDWIDALRAVMEMRGEDGSSIQK